MKFLNAHVTEIPHESERFDTLVSPSGTVATLNRLAQDHGLSHMGFDSAFPGPDQVKLAIKHEIENSLQAGDQPVLMGTTLVYNAEATLKLAEELKHEFHDHLKIVLGGQLIPFASQAFHNNPNIDAICIGDAEDIFPRLISDLHTGRLGQKYTNWLKNGRNRGKFAFVNYDHFYGLQDRLKKQREESGFSQLCIQGLGGPGCSWAAGNINGACDFCALQNITEMNTQPLEAQMAIEAELQRKFAPDRYFDVANQFLPFIDPRQNAQWLRKYIQVRNQYGVTVQKYAYLTVASINEEIAGLLKEAGIVEVYLGVDHFDAQALKEENKSHRTQRRLERTLNALRQNGISVRMGLVVGSSRESTRSLQSLEQGVAWLKSNYRQIIRSLGVFSIYVLPGSKVYERARQIPAAERIVNNFEQRGYFTKEEAAQLTNIYVQNHSQVSPEEVQETIDNLQNSVAEFAISYDVNHSPGAEVLRSA